MTATRVVTAADGPSAIGDLAGGGPVLVVTDADVRAAGALDTVAPLVAGVAVTDVPSGEPTLAAVDDLAALLRAERPRVVVALGGGSVIDATKIAAAIAPTPQHARDVLEGAGDLASEIAVVGVPTTAGSGAEMTRMAVVADIDGRKTWAYGIPLRPRLALLVPELTFTCPPRLTATTGLDALVHAVEAASSSRADAPDEAALEALPVIVDLLPRVLAAPQDATARTAMQRAASLAGGAIDRHGVGLGHNIGHALATVYGMTHGFSVALGLVATISWSVRGAPDRYRAAARALGVELDALPDRLERLLRDVDYARHASGSGPPELDPVRLARGMAADENRPARANNGRPAATEDLPELAEATALTWERLVA